MLDRRTGEVLSAEPFTHVNLLLYQGRNLDTVTQAEILTAFRLVRSRFDLIAAGETMLEAVDKVAEEHERNVKLFMLLLTSGDMKKRLCDILKLWLHEPAGIQTTSITVHEEGKTDRGALKVISRENLDDGRFRIIYRADFRDDSFAEVVTEWLKKHGERRRSA